MAAMPLVAGVDSSTQSTKVEIRDADTGTLVSQGRAPHPPTTPPRSEQDPATWWAAFEQASAAAGLNTGHRVEAISVAGQQHGMVVLDEHNEVIRPAKLWNDTESAPDAGWLHKQLPGGAAAWADAVGSSLVASFTITKLSWLHRSEPDAWQRLARVLLPHDWLTWKLCERFVTDRGDASGTGYWSPTTGEYRWDLLAIVDRDRDWTTALPAVLGPLDVAGGWGTTTVAPGTGDNMAAALGVGLAPGQPMVSIGTSGTVCTVSDAVSADATGAVAGFADATGRFLPLVCTLNAAKVTDAVAHLLGVSFDVADELAMESEPGAGGLTLLPYFDGERTPNRPDATGAVTGVRTTTTRSQLARAAYEGVVCGLLDGLAALGDRIDPAQPIVLVGGGARSHAYRKILADLSQRPVAVPEATELVALGACVQAASVLHQRPASEVAAAWGLKVGGTVLPEGSAQAAAAAAAIRERYAAARDA
jgi:xylulokinase